MQFSVKLVYLLSLCTAVARAEVRTSSSLMDSEPTCENSVVLAAESEAFRAAIERMRRDMPLRLAEPAWNPYVASAVALIRSGQHPQSRTLAWTNLLSEFIAEVVPLDPSYCRGKTNRFIQLLAIAEVAPDQKAVLWLSFATAMRKTIRDYMISGLGEEATAQQIQERLAEYPPERQFLSIPFRSRDGSYVFVGHQWEVLVIRASDGSLFKYSDFTSKKELEEWSRTGRLFPLVSFQLMQNLTTAHHFYLKPYLLSY